MLSSDRVDYVEYVKTAARQFFLKIKMESQIEPNAP